jgi:hypothetical protein
MSDKRIAFMCETEKAKLERMEDGNIKLELDTIDTVDRIIIDNNIIEIYDIDEVIFDQDNETYHVYYDNGEGTITSLDLQLKDSFLYVSEYTNDNGELEGIRFETRKLNIFDSYPQYRCEIKDGMIRTFCIPGMYMKEMLLLETKCCMESIVKNQQIQSFMYDIIKTVYSDYYNGQDTRFYIYHNGSIYLINDLRTNVASVSTTNMYNVDGYVPTNMIIPYEDLMMSKAILLTDEMLFINNDYIYKDGEVVGNVSQLDLAPIVYPLNDSDFQIKSGIIFMYTSMNSINTIMDIVNKNDFYREDLLKQAKDNISEIIKQFNEIEEEKVLEKYGATTVLLLYNGNVYVYNSLYIRNYLEQCISILDNVSDRLSDTFSNYVGLDILKNEE